MIKELKKSWKLLKYSYQFKTNIIFGLLFMGLGVVWLFLNGPKGLPLTVLYFYLGPIMVTQSSYNLLYGNQVASSMQKKMLDGTFPNVMGVGASLVSYAVMVIYMVFDSRIHSDAEISGGSMLLVVAMVLAVATIYSGVAFKYFVVATIFFTIGYMFASFVGMGTFMYFGEGISLLTGGLIGLVLVLVANVLGSLLRKVLYKHPISPLAAGMSLRKAMQ